MTGGESRSRPEERERAALLHAASIVIAERGFARATAHAIAERANVHQEVFDRHFGGSHDLIRALSRGFADRMLTTIDQSTRSGIWSGASARDVVEVAVRSIVDVVVEHQALVQGFLVHGTNDPVLADDLRRIGAHMAQRIVATFAECKNVPARPARAVAFSLLIAVSLVHHHILVGDGWTGVSFSAEQLAEEATRAICAYLGVDPPHRVER